MSAAVLVAAALSIFPSVSDAVARIGSPPQPASSATALTESALAVWEGGAWRSWWSSSAAPHRWTAPHATVARAVAWRTAQPGLEVGVARFAGANRLSRFNVALLRFDPAQLSLRLGMKRSPSGRTLPWGLADISADAAFALNAGMFDSVGPWGWLVLDGAERQAPGVGPLSSAVVVDSAGVVRIVAAPGIAATRASRVARWAVQSYPTALAGGVVPHQLRIGGAGVDREHRDTRLAIAVLHDGRVLVALTRFDGLGGALGAFPLGPTLPEMTAVLGALGARDAVFLDGGLSAQMAVRHADAQIERWDGMRRVPLWFAGFRR
ncbi:MAG: phosphodiester glycosidase family protein [Gemmatimonadaceae bacterium]|nr:phosphodiester glycosidase family protein [Gemmatimonadaceae bacterium]